MYLFNKLMAVAAVLCGGFSWSCWDLFGACMPGSETKPPKPPKPPKNPNFQIPEQCCSPKTFCNQIRRTGGATFRFGPIEAVTEDVEHVKKMASIGLSSETKPTPQDINRVATCLVLYFGRRYEAFVDFNTIAPGPAQLDSGLRSAINEAYDKARDYAMEYLKKAFIWTQNERTRKGALLASCPGAALGCVGGTIWGGPLGGLGGVIGGGLLTASVVPISQTCLKETDQDGYRSGPQLESTVICEIGTEKKPLERMWYYIMSKLDDPNSDPEPDQPPALDANEFVVDRPEEE